MANDTKVSLTIYVAGSTRHCLGIKEIPWKLTKQDLTSVELPKKEGKVVVKTGVAKVPHYEWIDASVHLNISKVAYDYMVSEEKPRHYHKKDWLLLKPKQRLAWHMAFIAETKGSSKFTYSVIDD